MKVGKWILGALCIMALLTGVGWSESVKEVVIEEDGMLSVDGERVFILGLYEYPEEAAVLEDAVAAGFNLVYARNESHLDQLEALDAWAWYNTGQAIDLSVNAEARQEALEALAAGVGQHPALLVWEVPDEALWNNWWRAEGWRYGNEIDALRELAAEQDPPVDITAELDEISRLYSYARYREGEDLAHSLWDRLGESSPNPELRLSEAEANALDMAEGMKAGYDYLKTLDSRPIWMNHAPRNMLHHLALFNEAADVVGCDIYPVPQTYRVTHSDLAEQSMGAVGAYTRRMQETASGKPVWMVLQGFGWGDIQPDQPEEIRDELRRPTLAETRFMAWDAIVHGARAILYWGSHAVEKDSEFWEELLSVVEELAELQPMLSAPDIPLAYEVSYHNVFTSMDRGVVALAKETPEGPWLILVNTFPGPVQFTLSGLEPLDGQLMEDIYSDLEIEIVDGSHRGFMRGQSVQVFRPQH